MNYLLDTKALIWFAIDSPELSEASRQALIGSNNAVGVSIVSFWEIAIKMSVSKLSLPYTLQELEREVLQENILVLDISVDDLEQTLRLPWHHKDPFDRLIAATALKSDLTLCSSDAVFDRYGVRRLW